MAANDKKTLMGYDPLAWLGQESEEVVVVEGFSTDTGDEVSADPEIESDNVHVEEIIESVGIESVAGFDIGESEFEVKVTAAVDMIDSVSSGDANEQLESETYTNETDMNAIADVSADSVSADPADEADAEPVIRLDSMLTIQSVGKLYDKIKKSYSVNSSIEIDATQVSSIDTATLQLLVALKKDAAKKQKVVVFADPSNRFKESAELLGLLDLLGLEA